MALVLRMRAGDEAGNAVAGANQRSSHQQQQPTSLAQGIPLPCMPEFKHYWVGNSTIPGAGLGVFARTDMPAGTIWNPEDAHADNTIAINLRQWQGLLGLEEHLRQAGHSSHPFTTLRAFFDEYPYICDDYFIASLTGTTFTNHAPSAPTASSKLPAASLCRKTSAGNARKLQQHARSLAAAAADHVRYANSGDVTPEMVAAKGLSPWHLCTLVVTLRDVRAGEEMLEDYTPYNTPCSTDKSCPEYMQQQGHTAGASGEKAASSQQPQQEWSRAVQVPSSDVIVGNSSSNSRPGGGLGVFAARHLPAGTVWNKEDAAHALTVTRGQWSTLSRLERSLAAAHASKPLISALTVADVREGEELVVVQQQQQLGDCDWPGLRLSTS
ncbi:hypothetical protein OEZ86_003990 [Tetradesmus obliquus]|nr:hypothetical protein OEZ86_003990 [Tetradesmus obliquus]